MSAFHPYRTLRAYPAKTARILLVMNRSRQLETALEVVPTCVLKLEVAQHGKRFCK